MTSLNPVFTVGNQMVEGLGLYYEEEDSKSLKGRAVDILRRMGVLHQIAELWITPIR